jgi:hypothetical protein
MPDGTDEGGAIPGPNVAVQVSARAWLRGVSIPAVATSTTTSVASKALIREEYRA